MSPQATEGHLSSETSFKINQILTGAGVGGKLNSTCKKVIKGTFLVVQWLRSPAPSEGAWVRSLVWELDPTCYK